MKIMKKILCTVLVVVLCLTSAPLSGFVGLELPEWNLKASAATEYTEGYYTYTVVDGQAYITNVDKSISGDIVIPDTLGGYPVVEISNYGAFIYCDNLTGVTIPGSIKEIVAYSFAECKNLNSVYVSDGVEHIHDAVFAGCSKLSNIRLPDSISFICNDTFYGTLYYDTDSNWENGVLYIGHHLVAAKKTLTGKYKVKDGTKVIGWSAFQNCEELTGIVLPNSVTYICASAFSGCSNLANITIPDCEADISRNAFGGSLYEETATNWDNNVLYVDNHLITARNGLLEDEKIKGNYEIKKGTCNISPSAFSFCQELESIVIPDSVIKIRENTFLGCTGLKSVTLSNSIKSIGESAFYLVESSLTDVYFYGTEAEWNAIDIGVLNEDLLNATIHFLGEDDECKHNLIEQTIPATCTMPGAKYMLCTECGEAYDLETIPATGHKYKVTARTEATCTEDGSITYTCVCNDTYTEIIPAKGHTPGVWETVLEPTYESDGKKVIKCTVCGVILEEEIIPKLELESVFDDTTGVGFEYQADKYNGEVGIIVEEVFDGSAFNMVDRLNPQKSMVFDIKLTVDGKVTQPNGKITVKIPLPSDYNSAVTSVVYINLETGELETMNATYEDGYMVFETDHFSYYAIIAEPDTDNCSCNCHAGGIKKFFFKFLLFFQKIFRTNKECKCGIKHY